MATEIFSKNKVVLDASKREQLQIWQKNSHSLLQYKENKITERT
jgi:hypothetical protein